jgi:bifunctional DNA primase/polymerase-like protein
MIAGPACAVCGTPTAYALYRAGFTTHPTCESGSSSSSSSRPVTTIKAPSGLSLLPAALAYARRGWPVIRLLPGRKDPVPGSRGSSEATTDPMVIRGWWREMPSANIGIATGHPGPDVLDVDLNPHKFAADEIADTEAAFVRLMKAGYLSGAYALISTWSGGYHVYFAGTDQRNSTRVGNPRFDVRGAGGYVVAPPSIVRPYTDRSGKPVHGPDEGVYEHVKTAGGSGTLNAAGIREFLSPPRPATRPIGRSVSADGQQAGIARKVKELAGSGEPRHDALRWAAQRGLAAEQWFGLAEDLYGQDYGKREMELRRLYEWATDNRMVEA